MPSEIRQKSDHQITVSVVPQMGRFNIVTKDYFSLQKQGVILMLLSFAGDVPQRVAMDLEVNTKAKSWHNKEMPLCVQTVYI